MLTAISLCGANILTAHHHLPSPNTPFTFYAQSWARILLLTPRERVSEAHTFIHIFWERIFLHLFAFFSSSFSTPPVRGFSFWGTLFHCFTSSWRRSLVRFCRNHRTPIWLCFIFSLFFCSSLLLLFIHTRRCC